MCDYNISIWVDEKYVDEARAYLKIRSVPFKCTYTNNEYRIDTPEKFYKILDRCGLKFSK